ncbi:MAG TPA: cytochrome ubiquinol oxidase subunit I, partial [Pseudonocardia sp.]
RFVGDVFGAPLAIEGLLAFFLESTFLGLWIFGWDRLPKRIHLATIWLASIGTMLSAYFILAANSWMQHPVGWRLDPVAHRAVMTDFPAVLTNPTLLVTFPHTLLASFATAAAFVVAVSAWQLRHHRADHTSGHNTNAAGQPVPTARESVSQREVFRPSLRLGLVTLLIAAVGVMISGDAQARVMTAQQPMKMAAAEALYDTAAPASFSLFTIGALDGSRELYSIRVPGVLSLLATGSPSGEVAGINNVQRAEAGRYGPGDYRPNVPVAYWTFRIMVGLGLYLGLLSLIGLWLMRGGRTPTGRWFFLAAMAGLVSPFLANSVGWIFTEMGRQPWAVYGVMRTAAGVSPSVPAGTVLTSLIVFTVLYGVLAVLDLWLMTRYARAGAAPTPQPTRPGSAPGSASGSGPGAEPGSEPDADESSPPPVFAY